MHAVPSQSAARNSTAAISYLVLTLNTTERAAFVARNSRVLPEMEVVRAINGFDKRETIAALAASGLRYHLFTYCSFTCGASARSCDFCTVHCAKAPCLTLCAEAPCLTLTQRSCRHCWQHLLRRFGTFGSLANWLTKYYMLRQQVRRRLPVMAMLEDDMDLQTDFRAFVERMVRTHLLAKGLRRAVSGRRPESPEPAMLVLGPWGEGYVTTLASAKRIVRRMQQQGIPLNVDIFLNDGHAGSALRVGPVPWVHRMGPNLGDCLKTAHIAMHDLPKPLVLHPPHGAAGLRWGQTMRARYCHTRPNGHRTHDRTMWRAHALHNSAATPDPQHRTGNRADGGAFVQRNSHTKAIN